MLLRLTKCGITPKKRRKIWVWFAVARVIRKVIAFEVGSRGKKTLKRLLAKLSVFNIRLFCTDRWKIYRALIPADRLIQSKRETCLVESLNCNVRHYLARFRRHSRCYSKSPLMVVLACYLLFENHLTIY
jgi:insertion element IS1 protein InsB